MRKPEDSWSSARAMPRAIRDCRKRVLHLARSDSSRGSRETRPRLDTRLMATLSARSEALPERGRSGGNYRPLGGDQASCRSTQSADAAGSLEWKIRVGQSAPIECREISCAPRDYSSARARAVFDRAFPARSRLLAKVISNDARS